MSYHAEHLPQQIEGIQDNNNYIGLAYMSDVEDLIRL